MNLSAPTLSAIEASVTDKRRHQRHAVRIDAILHIENVAQPARINDLSAGGLGLTGAIGTAIGQYVEVELATGRRLQGTIVWQLSGCCGIEFDSELQKSDALLQAAAQGEGA